MFLTGALPGDLTQQRCCEEPFFRLIADKNS
jgi:hypothetical protein